jgi:hypothetical protein
MKCLIHICDLVLLMSDEQNLAKDSESGIFISLWKTCHLTNTSPPYKAAEWTSH